jgi:endonuclease/exonuclease/phosphatase family metal-dependent hydrolase
MIVTFLLILASTGPLDVDVMTFNIRYGTAPDGENRWEKRRDLVFEVIREHHPDVIGLQEAMRFQIDDICKAVPGYAEVGEGRDGGEKGEYSAILYREKRFRVREAGTFWLSETPGEPSRGLGAACRRICTWGWFEERGTGRSLHVYNTHLDHGAREAREKGILLIVDRVAGKAPVIVTGDFNAAERSEAMQSLRSGGMVDTYRVLHPDAKDVGTYHAFTGNREGEKIDGIFASSGIEVVEARILTRNNEGRYPSDHFPVTARVQVTGPERRSPARSVPFRGQTVPGG